MNFRSVVFTLINFIYACQGAIYGSFDYKELRPPYDFIIAGVSAMISRLHSTDILPTGNLSQRFTILQASTTSVYPDFAGPFANGVVNHLTFTRVPNDSSIFVGGIDPSTGPHSPHFEFMLGWNSPLIMMNFIPISICRRIYFVEVQQSIRWPLIDPAYITSHIDLRILKEGIASARRFLSAPAWKDIILGPQGAFANAVDDETLEEFIRDTIAAGLHAVGTVSMSPRRAKYGVVDPDLRVKGVDGLRVVDASVMPIIPSGNTQAPTYVIAERATDFIKEVWSKE